MVKVRALQKGYVGLILREAGEVFEWPDDVPLGSWVKKGKGGEPFGGKGDHDGDGKIGGGLPHTAAGTGDGATIPENWKSLNAADKKALAEGISGHAVRTAKEADEIISARLGAGDHENSQTPEPFADAPPVRVQNEVNEATGGTQPDWLPPSGDDDQPVPADD